MMYGQLVWLDNGEDVVVDLQDISEDLETSGEYLNSSSLYIISFVCDVNLLFYIYNCNKPPLQ